MLKVAYCFDNSAMLRCTFIPKTIPALIGISLTLNRPLFECVGGGGCECVCVWGCTSGCGWVFGWMWMGVCAGVHTCFNQHR